MGYRDSDFINPLDLFPVLDGAGAGGDASLHQRMRLGEGRPLARIEELAALAPEWLDEPSLRVEYDRFSPALRRAMRRR